MESENGTGYPSSSEDYGIDDLTEDWNVEPSTSTSSKGGSESAGDGSGDDWNVDTSASTSSKGGSSAGVGNGDDWNVESASTSGSGDDRNVESASTSGNGDDWNVESLASTSSKGGSEAAGVGDVVVDEKGKEEDTASEDAQGAQEPSGSDRLSAASSEDTHISVS